MTKRDKPEHNRNIYHYPLELFDCFHNLYFIKVFTYISYPWKEGRKEAKACIVENKHDYVQKLFFTLFVYADTNSDLILEVCVFVKQVPDFIKFDKLKRSQNSSSWSCSSISHLLVIYANIEIAHHNKMILFAGLGQ